MLDFALGMANTCRSYSTVAMKRAVTWLFLPTTVESSILTSRGTDRHLDGLHYST